MKKIKIFIFLFLLLLNTQAYADDLEFKYNLRPVIDNMMIIDGSIYNELDFFLYEEEPVFHNGKKIDTNDKYFSVDISQYEGTTNLEFTNEDNEIVVFSYFIYRGKELKEHNVGELKEYAVHTDTIDEIQLIYTTEDVENKELIKTWLKELPAEFKIGTERIILIPNSHYENRNIAGIAYMNEVKLYNLSRLSLKSKKMALYHELAHLWANKLIQYKLLDYSYTDYEEFAKKDKFYVSEYTKRYLIEKRSYSEDFAESVAQYIYNTRLFKKKFPNRGRYLERLFYITGVNYKLGGM